MQLDLSMDYFRGTSGAAIILESFHFTFRKVVQENDSILDFSRAYCTSLVCIVKEYIGVISAY